MVRQAPVICVMVPPIHLGAWSMALMLWLPFELLLLLLSLLLYIKSTGDKTGMVVGASVLVCDRYVHAPCVAYTHFPPHEPYIVANDCEYYTVGYSCAIDA